ncbi:hypothetical protein M569_04373 [Genlisea aurea]|uniref:Inhibitor I9 domain-containing protein n=1 Tax=Genlisea aurea TaxID=192259 RepID=S8ECZ2_9LAMI|nr:hypothetical protein M569_04373 [Genlisea aurea]
MEETNKENMKKILQLVGCLFVSFLVEGGSAQFENDEVYIVYMGASVSSNGAPRNEHGPLLSSVMKRKRNAVLHTYSNGFSGFAARLSKEEVNSIAQMPEVLSVFKDPILNLHTTRSWEFLRYQDALKIDSATESYTGADVILGILDTGIWPESESFSDEGMSPVPSRWKGTCMEGRNFTSSNCNR